MKWYLFVLIVALLGGGAIVYERTRGIRNNNPGSIRYSPNTTWQGQIGSDGAFVIFDTMQNGVRALGKTLLTYYNHYGLNTVQSIVTRWAPPSENDTGAYINSVANQLGVGPFTPLKVPDVLPELIKAIIRHENGSIGMLFISEADLMNGTEAALA